MRSNPPIRHRTRRAAGRQGVAVRLPPETGTSKRWSGRHSTLVRDLPLPDDLGDGPLEPESEAGINSFVARCDAHRTVPVRHTDSEPRSPRDGGHNMNRRAP